MDKLIMHVRGEIILSIDSLIKFIEMFSKPTAVPERQVLHISIISCSFTASRNIELTSFGGKKELCDFSDTGILLAKLGPMLVKYLQKKLAISFGLEISRESALNIDGKPRFPLFLLRISFRIFQVALTFDLVFQFVFHNINARLATRRE